jgi:ABC-type transport system substrate-binding protein
MNTDPNPRIAQAIQQDLAAIGIKANIQNLAQANVIAAGGAGTAPMIWSGGMAWIADFPDPSNFYGPILGCGGAVEGGWNWSKYLQRGARQGHRGRQHVRSGQGRRAAEAVVRDLHGRDGGGALGPGLQRGSAIR